MSSALRLFTILVLVLAAAALGLIASNAYRPKPDEPVAQVVPQTQVPVPLYLVAAHPLQSGTWLRDEDIAARPLAPETREKEKGATADTSKPIPDTPTGRSNLRGSIVRKYVDANAPITLDVVVSPRDKGFLASVLDPNTRAVSVSVDPESGVSGLVWPGDLVDVVLTQANDKATQSHRAQSETVLHGIRVVAIDQDIAEGVPVNGGAGGRAGRSVTLQLNPEEVNVLAVARALGRLSLAVRSAAIDKRDTPDAGAKFDCDVSLESARKSTVMIYAGGASKAFSVGKDDGDATARGCDAAKGVARNVALTGSSPDKASADTSNPEERR